MITPHPPLPCAHAGLVAALRAAYSPEDLTELLVHVMAVQHPSVDLLCDAIAEAAGPVEASG